MAELRIASVDGLKYDVGKIKDRMDCLTLNLANCNSNLSSSFESLSCRVNLLEDNMSEVLATLRELQDYLRPATSAKTENPKRKDDLEIFPQTVLDEDFLKLNDNMFLIDL